MIFFSNVQMRGFESIIVKKRNVPFNAGGIKGKHLGERSINNLTDRFCVIDHLLEHKLNIRNELIQVNVLRKDLKKGGVSLRNES